MKPSFAHLERYRMNFVPALATPHGLHSGAFYFTKQDGSVMRIIAHDGITGDGPEDVTGWEHVSISVQDHKGHLRTPVWSEMCHVKNLFWDDEESVIQFHPPRSEYVNHHPHTLHLWRPLGFVVPTPPSDLVGPKS